MLNIIIILLSETQNSCKVYGPYTMNVTYKGLWQSKLEISLGYSVHD